MNAYFLMAALFGVMAVLQAADAALVSVQILPWFNGIRWLRVHLVTLGIMTEALFGVLPLVVAWRHRLPRPRIKWRTWFLLNGGLLGLLAGIPLIAKAPIYLGGGMIFLATLSLFQQLHQLRYTAVASDVSGSSGKWFYLMGLAYFLVGITVGTGIFFDWAAVLKIKVPIEVHIHANNWGLISMVFAGLLVDLYPRWSGRSLAWPRSITPIFWLMTIGALGLVLGPWTGSRVALVPGLVMHLAATVWLLLNVIKPLRDSDMWRKPGIWHLTGGYLWLLAPVLIAPLILFNVPGFPGAGVEQNAPQALIYGWVLQGAYALLPYLFGRVLQPEAPTRLGGSWWSLAAIHAGSILLWTGIFIDSARGILHGAAYGLWAVSLIPIVVDLWRLVRIGWSRIEASQATEGLSL